MTSPLLVRGAAEAHPGVPWSWAARERMVRYLGDLGFTLYVYAPQGDPLNRERWGEPYLRDEVDAFVDMAQVGARRGVNFCYALAPSEPEAGQVVNKLRPLYDGGIRCFAFLTYGEVLSAPVLETFPGATIFSAPGTDLPPAVEVLVKRCGAVKVTEAARSYRRPPVLWEPYPAPANSLNLRPAPGWAPGAYEEVAGVVVECGPYPEAARVALHTWAACLRTPAGYDAERSWVQALAHVAGEAAPSLRLLGDLTRNTAREEPATAFPPGVTDYRARLESWARAAEALKNLPDKPLREDLKPWVAKLALSADAGLKALAAVAAPPAQAEKARGLALSSLWRLREHVVWVAGDQVERFVRDCLRRL